MENTDTQNQTNNNEQEQPQPELFECSICKEKYEYVQKLYDNNELKGCLCYQHMYKYRLCQICHEILPQEIFIIGDYCFYDQFPDIKKLLKESFPNLLNRIESLENRTN